MTRRTDRIARSPGRRAGRGAALLMVLIIVAVIFVVGLAAISTATRSTQAGRNFLAYENALQAAQSGVEMAYKRLSHPWYVGYDFGETWPGTDGFDALPAPGDGKGRMMDPWYSITVSGTDDEFLVTVVGRAVAPGGSPTVAEDVLAERTVQAVYQRPLIEVPYAVLAGGDLTITSNVDIQGDVFANGNVLVLPGGRVSGDVYATGNVVNIGIIGGNTYTNEEPVNLPPITYYGYRPNYDYGGFDTQAIELGGTSLSGTPPMGMPDNPNNVFYKDFDYSLASDVQVSGGTLVFKYDVTVWGQAQITATAGFPSMIINDDLVLAGDCQLQTTGLLMLGDDVKGRFGASCPDAQWHHEGPVVIRPGGTLSDNLAAPIQIRYRIDRTEYQPVGRMVLPMPMTLYTESP